MVNDISRLQNGRNCSAFSRFTVAISTFQVSRNIKTAKKKEAICKTVIYWGTRFCHSPSREMADLLADELNLLLLRDMVSGRATSVNLSYLSRVIHKHRNTIRKTVADLFAAKIINPPIFPFMGLYKEYSLLVAVRADLPDDEMFKNWIRDDKHIFAAFRSRQGEYNTLLFIFHRDVLSYQLWRESLVPSGKIPPRDTRYPSSAYFFSNQLMVKYEPSAAIHLMEEQLKNEGKVDFDDYTIDELDFKVLRCLVTGKGIKVNENLLSKATGVHRSTVERRISEMLAGGWVSRPVCRFPNFFVPPNYLLVFSMYEIKKSKEEILREIRKDLHIAIALEISHGRYNLLTFENYLTVPDHQRWEREYSNRFPGCFGSAEITYLTPEMTVSIDQQKVSLGIIEEKLRRVQGK